MSGDGGSSGKQRAGGLAVIVAVGAVLAVLLQATELGERIAGWFGGDDAQDGGRVVAVDLASAVSLAEAGRSVSPVRECFEVAKQPEIIVRQRSWPPLAAVQLIAQVGDETPTATPSPTASPTPTPDRDRHRNRNRDGEPLCPSTPPAPRSARHGEEIEVVVKPARTPAPTPPGGPAPPPPGDDAKLVDGAAQNVMVFPQSYTREEIERLAPQVRVGPPAVASASPRGSSSTSR